MKVSTIYRIKEEWEWWDECSLQWDIQFEMQSLIKSKGKVETLTFAIIPEIYIRDLYPLNTVNYTKSIALSEVEEWVLCVDNKCKYNLECALIKQGVIWWK